MVASSLDREIRVLAGQRCEYCHLPDGFSRFAHALDHIVARQHHGGTTRENLALCCARCNQFKGPNLTGIDPETGEVTTLFHPRRQTWADHFRWEGPVIVGRSTVGRTTVDVLAMNLPIRVALRQVLMDEGVLITDSAKG